MKSQFIKNLESIPFDMSQLGTPEFEPLQQVYEFVIKKQNLEAALLLLDFMENELNRVLERKNYETPLKMLIIDATPRLHKKIKDLALDIMIAVEEESLDESKYQDFISRIRNLKN